MFPFCNACLFVEHVEIPPDALDADVKREHRLEDRGQDEQRQQRHERRERQRGRGHHERAPGRESPGKDVKTRGPALADRRTQRTVFKLFTLRHRHVLSCGRMERR